MPAKLLIESIQDTDNICKWNKTLTTSKVLKRLNDNVGITHQVRPSTVVHIVDRAGVRMVN